MTKQKTIEEKVSMPYNVEVRIVEAILDTLGREHEIPVGDLFRKIIAKNKPDKSNALAMCKFLGLIDAEGTQLRLTKLGFKYINTSQKKDFVAHNLPEKYLTILGWAKNNNGTMSLDEIKKAIIDNWGNPPKERVFQSMLRTFANYCSHIGVLKYVKGTAGRVELTQLGFSILGTPKVKNSETDVSEFERNNNAERINVLPSEGNYPIRIITKDGKPFDWDIHTEEDWTLVETALKAIKARWKQNYNHSGDSNVSDAGSNSR